MGKTGAVPGQLQIEEEKKMSQRKLRLNGQAGVGLGDKFCYKL